MERYIGRDIKGSSNQSPWKKYVAIGSTVLVFGLGAIDGLVYDFKHTKGAVQKGADTVFNKPVVTLPKKKYQIGQVIEIQTENGKKLRRQITSPKDVADMLLESTVSECIPQGMDSYGLGNFIEDLPENEKYKGRNWYNLPKGTEFTAFGFKPVKN